MFNSKEKLDMKKFIAIAALALSSTAYAEISPESPPEGVRVDIVDREICTNTFFALNNHVRNMLNRHRAAGETWYTNSKGEYLAFKCFYYSRTHRYQDGEFGVVYVIDAATMQKMKDAELREARRIREEKQNALKATGYL